MSIYTRIYMTKMMAKKEISGKELNHEFDYLM